MVAHDRNFFNRCQRITLTGQYGWRQGHRGHRLQGESVRCGCRQRRIAETKDKKNFLELYLKLAMEQGVLEMTIHDKSNSPMQKYRLTESGRRWIEEQKR